MLTRWQGEVHDPEFVRQAAEKFGSQCIVVAIDAKARGADSGGGFEVYTHGGRKPTGLDAIEWARRMVALGAGEILLTSMDRDGTKEGFDIALTRAVSDAVSVPTPPDLYSPPLRDLVRRMLSKKARFRPSMADVAASLA